MKLFIALSAFGILASLAISSSNVHAECVAYDAAIAIADKTAAESGAIKTSYEGADGQAVLKAINDVPPQTDLKGEAILTLDFPDLGYVIVGIRENGQICHTVRVGSDGWKEIVRKGLGSPL